MNEPVVVIGAGGWGTALAVVLARKGLPVTVWALEPEVRKQVESSRENSSFLPGVPLPAGVSVTGSMADALATPARAIVMAVPTNHIRSVAPQLAAWRGCSSLVVSVAKGLETSTGLRPSEIISKAMGVGPDSLCVLSGPSHAEEVGRDLPTAVVAASASESTAKRAQMLFFSPRFRVYTNTDMVGVEIAAALKNVIAVACGISDGLGFGDNTRAALITRGLAEITRLGVELGGSRETFWGLAGVGDLVVTCTSKFSRNRGLGQRIGAGESLAAIQAGMKQVAEGVHAARAAQTMARSRSVSMPITEQVCAVLFDGKPAAAAMADLLAREMRSEQDGAGAA